jgi:hypothetical protein
MRHPPTIALVAPWPKRWSISQDLSYKIRVFTLVTEGGPYYALYPGLVIMARLNGRATSLPLALWLPLVRQPWYL